MRLSLLESIRTFPTKKAKSYVGAVFLTYSLNLGFFEQILLPTLEGLDCANNLILADPDGYAEAINASLKNVRFAGLRYVCSMIPRVSSGVQHGKIILLAGKNFGKLLIGSGNLTMYGFSRNLETFTEHIYLEDSPDPVSLNAFSVVWELLRDLVEYEGVGGMAREQLKRIENQAPWLNAPLVPLPEQQVWHDYNQSLWSQLSDWQVSNIEKISPLKSLRVFSPYYDKDGKMLRIFTEELRPKEVIVYFSERNTNMNGEEMAAHWPRELPMPRFVEIEDKTDASKRLLHGKMIIGEMETGAWCISGSANMTAAAFDRHWRSGSNLEIVRFNWSDDPHAFDYLVEPQLIVMERELTSISASTLGNSEEPRKVFSTTVYLSDVRFDAEHKMITGVVNHLPKAISREGLLSFARSGNIYEFRLTDEDKFSVDVSENITESESVTVIFEQSQSLPCWVDVPRKLYEYNLRADDRRISVRLSSNQGVEELFHDLMESLFDRNKVNSIPKNQREVHSYIKRNGQTDGNEEVVDAPPVDWFIVPDRDENGVYQPGHHVSENYHRDIVNLRDLLSIVLLNLTKPNDQTDSKVDRSDIDGQIEEDAPVEPVDVESIDVVAITRQKVRQYLLDYCRKYSQRICQIEFIEKLSPEIFLENQITISRVIFEFIHRLPEFTKTDAATCFWSMWAPIVAPRLIGLDEKSTLSIFESKGETDSLVEEWEKYKLGHYFALMISESFDKQWNWETSKHRTDETKSLIKLKELIGIFERIFLLSQIQVEEQGSFGIPKYDAKKAQEDFEYFKAYLPPNLSRVIPLINWYNAYKLKDGTEIEKMTFILQQSDLVDIFKTIQANPLPILALDTIPDDEEMVYCPRCSGAIRPNVAKAVSRGEIALCTSGRDAWLYKEEKL